MAYFLLVYGSRIDSLEGSAFMVSAAPRRAAPLGIAAFLLAFDFGRRWTGIRRFGFGVLAGGLVWTIAWQSLAYQARYPERRLRGLLIERCILRSEAESRRRGIERAQCGTGNESHAKTPGTQRGRMSNQRTLLKSESPRLIFAQVPPARPNPPMLGQTHVWFNIYTWV